MDSAQIKAICQDDTFLKKINSQIIFEKEVPDIIEENCIYFVHIPSGQTTQRGNDTSYFLGHWILIETLPVLKRHLPSEEKVISYLDPYGAPPSSPTFKKIKKTASLKKLAICINSLPAQLPSTTICGGVCTYYSLLRSRGFSPTEIIKCKLSKNQRLNAQVIPDIVNSLMPRGMRKIERFSIDFL